MYQVPEDTGNAWKGSKSRHLPVTFNRLWNKSDRLDLLNRRIDVLKPGPPRAAGNSDRWSNISPKSDRMCLVRLAASGQEPNKRNNAFTAQVLSAKEQGTLEGEDTPTRERGPTSCLFGAP